MGNNKIEIKLTFLIYCSIVHNVRSLEKVYMNTLNNVRTYKHFFTLHIQNAYVNLSEKGRGL